MGSGLLGSGDLPAAVRLLLRSDDLPRRYVVAQSFVLATFLRAGYPWRALLHLSSSMGHRIRAPPWTPEKGEGAGSSAHSPNPRRPRVG